MAPRRNRSSNTWYWLALGLFLVLSVKHAINHLPPDIESWTTLLSHDSGDSQSPGTCSIAHLGDSASSEEICHYIRTQCDAHTYNYAISYYCSNPSLNGNHFMRLLRSKFTSVSFVFAYLVVLFISLGITASDYLCPNLNYATVYLNLSQRVAGMTLMAYGNGAPDLFSSYSSIKSGSPELAFGELIGAANFCVCFVIGAMGICNSFEVDPPQFLCDVGFFIALLIISLVFICDGKLTLLESGIMIILYASYILFLVKYNFSNEPSEEIDENSTLLSPYAPPHASLRPLTPTSSVLSPMASPNQASQSVMRFSVYDAVKLWSHLGDLRCGMSKESLLQENYDATEEQEAAGGDQIQQGVPSHDRPSTQISPSDLREIIHHSPFAYKVDSPRSDYFDDRHLLNCPSPLMGVVGRNQASLTPSVAEIHVPYDPEVEAEDLSRIASPRPKLYQSIGQPSFIIDEASDTEDTNSEFPCSKSSILPVENAVGEEIWERGYPLWRFLLPEISHVMDVYKAHNLCNEEMGSAGSPSGLSVPSVIFSLFSSPIILLFNATIPTVYDIGVESPPPADQSVMTLASSESLVYEGFRPIGYAESKLRAQLLYGQVFFLPILVDYHYFSLKDEISQWWGEYPGSIIPKSMHLIILAAVSLALVVLHHWYYRHCSQSHSQDHQGLHHYYHNRLPPIIAFLGFFLSIVWINIISDHVVLLLKNIGLMYRIGDSLLGLTVFATGNSVGDLIGNVTLARSHLSLTGLGACFGAPLLYILLGLGLNGVILITTTRQGRPIEFKFDISLIVGSAGVLGMLVVYLVVVPMNGWVIGRKLGIFAVLWWGIITGINVYLDY